MNERSIPRPVRDTFTQSYALIYESHSAKPPHSYEIAASVLARLAGGIQDGDTIVEIGAGTGNSTILLAESNPNLHLAIAIEPSAAFAQIAHYKFGDSSFQIPQETDPLTQDYLGYQRQRGFRFQDKVQIVVCRGQFLPLRSESVDNIYCASSFHWLSASDEDGKQGNLDYLKVSLAEFHRILKKDGKLFFDSSGFQFDFEDKGVGSHKANREHFFSLIKNGGRMRYFESEELSQLTDDQKDTFIIDAFEKTLRENRSLADFPSAEFFASFAARKVLRSYTR